MTSILDYLKWRGDLPFEKISFGEIDLLIFAQLVHTPMENLTADHKKSQLRDLTEILYPEAPKGDENTLPIQRYGLWNEVVRSERFASVRLKRFVSHFVPQEEKQFAAALFAVGDTGIVAFRGTDSTLVGWKEDFNMSFESPVPSQLEAVNFLESCALGFRELYVCGHSKGGNLAMYASAMCSEKIQNLITGVFSYDGPGMDDLTLKSDGWQRISSRIYSYIPESSIVGLLLGHEERHIVIESDSMSIWQHNPYYWHVMGAVFDRAETTTFSSRFLDETMHRFIAGCTAEERRILVDNLFNVLNATEAKRLKELPSAFMTHLDGVSNALKAIPPEERKVTDELMKTLLSSGGDSIRSMVPNLFEKLLKVFGINTH